MLLAMLERYSDGALMMGERQLLLSLLGFVCVLVIHGCWRGQSSASRLSVWLFFVVWLSWGALLFTPEYLAPLQAAARQSLNRIVSDDIFSFCSQSATFRHLPPPASFLPTVGWSVVLLGLWVVLAMLKYAVHWRKRRDILRLATQAVELQQGVAVDLVHWWRSVLGVRRDIQVRTSERSAQAFTYGVWRPVIFIPRVMLEELQPHQMSAVIGHEVAHIKRLDDLAIQLQNLLRAVFFFNPVLTIANNRIAELREHCCDRLAIQAGKLSSREFGESLLRALSLNGDGRYNARELPADTVAGLGKAAVKRRIESLLDQNARFSYAPLVSVGVGLVTLSLLFGQSPSTPLPPESSAQWLTRIDAAAPVSGNAIRSKPFQWPEACLSVSADRSRYHPGVDFATPLGQRTPVLSIADGKVLYAFQRDGHWRVYVEHAEGIVSTYLHLDSPLVKAGDELRRGSVIAVNQGTTHSYVHVEVHRRGQVLDPSYLLDVAAP